MILLVVNLFSTPMHILPSSILSPIKDDKWISFIEFSFMAEHHPARGFQWPMENNLLLLLLPLVNPFKDSYSTYLVL